MSDGQDWPVEDVTSAKTTAVDGSCPMCEPGKCPGGAHRNALAEDGIHTREQYAALKTTAVDDARKVVPVRRLCPNCGNMTYGECCPEYWALRDDMEAAGAQLSEQRTTIERLERENKTIHAFAAQWHSIWLLHATGSFDADAWMAEYKRIFELAEHNAQLEQDKLKLEGELRQEREAHAETKRELNAVGSTYDLLREAAAKTGEKVSTVPGDS